MISSSQTKNYLLLILISIIWGSQFVFTNFALKDFSALWIAAFRAIIGAATLSSILFAYPIQRHAKVKKLYTYIPFVFLIGLFDGTLPFSLLAWGQTQVNSSIAAILIGTVPIFTAIFATISLKSEKLHIGTITTIILGFCGIVTLVAPNLTGSWSSIYQNLIGELAIVGCAMAFSISLVLMKFLPVPPIRGARDILIAASIQILLIVMLFGDSFPTSAHFQSIFSAVFLGIVNTGIVYVFFLVLVHSAGSTFASFGNYLAPVVGVLFGTLILGNSIARHELIALGFIITGLLLNSYLTPKSSKSTLNEIESG